MKKGIVIIAVNSPLYGRMAYNLAVTIKATGTSIPVSIIADDNGLAHLNSEQKKLFDSIIRSEYDWNKIRFNIDSISPYDHTLQLDADLLWLWKDPDILFTQAKSMNFLVTNYGSFDPATKMETVTGDYLWWADIRCTAKAYELASKIYQTCWEMAIWKKGVITRKILAAAEEIRMEPKVGVKLFENQVCVEFCFNVAVAKANFFMPSPWLPVKRARQGRFKTVRQLSDEQYAVSFAGNRADAEEISLYDTIMQAACYKLGLRQTFKLQSKKEHLTTRKSI